MGLQLRKMLRARVVVVFGATSRIGRATVEALTAAHQQQDTSVAVVAAVDNVKDPRARRLKRATKCYLAKCVFSESESIRRVVRNADSVLLVPALSESGTRFSKRVIDAVQQEAVPRLVILSSILATNDFWRRRHHREDAAKSGGPIAAPAASADFGYEAVEAHARSTLDNCVSLRIPLLMETIMFCREEIMFAGRFNGCFDPDTLIPCIAASDVGAAAARVLAKPTEKFNSTYCLASADVTCSPRDIEQQFTRALGKCVKYRQVPDEHLVELLRERGATMYVAQSMVRFKNYLEFGDSRREMMPVEEKDDERKLPGAVRDVEDKLSREEVEARRLQIARFGYTNDFQSLVGRGMMAPAAWLESHQRHFARSPDNEMQLFVLGSGEGLFAEFERFLARQVTSATAAPASEVGEAAIPTTSDGAMQGKVTFCSITAISKPLDVESGGSTGAQPPQGAPESYFCHVQGKEVSPIDQLAKQFSQLDVVVYIQPLHLSPDERFEVTRVVVDAALKANVWGIVLVSALYTGTGSGELLNRAGRVEQFVERSGLPYVIVRLPLFMEYFTALSSADHLDATEETVSERTFSGVGPHGDDDEEEQKPPVAPESAAIPVREKHWSMLDRSLATSRLHLIAMADAVKALTAIAYTFPLHQNRTRTLYTETLTVHEIETVLKANAYKNRPIDFAQVDALYEHPTREFWRLAYWTKGYTKEFLECAVALSAHAAPIEMGMDFEEITECEPISLARWAQANARSYTHPLQIGGVRESL